jgi:membrane-bound ClpP family serine protease
MSYLIWPLLLLAVGLILLVTEAFLPSGGLIGLLALGCLGVSLYQAFNVPEAPYLGWKFVAAEVLLIPVALVIAVQMWPRTPLGRRMSLRPPTPEEFEAEPPLHRLDHLIGEYGRALTPMRPSGSVDFDGRRLDALAEDELIPAGTLIRAVRIHAGVLVVRKAEDDALRWVDA